MFVFNMGLKTDAFEKVKRATHRRYAKGAVHKFRSRHVPQLYKTNMSLCLNK